MEQIIALILGTFYGLVIGIIPAAGATTGLVALFSFIGYFGDPYTAVVFCMAVVAASTTGDTYTGVLLGIPGANSSAATVVDGYPLAQKGRATEAITAAVITSTLNGLLWGTLTFSLLPWYSNLIMILGIPELWAFTILALSTVGFISNRYWFRSILAICLGLFIGSIGVDPNTNSDRFTMGWDYLADGVQLMTFVAGLFAIPEMLEGFTKGQLSTVKPKDNYTQTKQGARAVWQYKWDALRGGFIGAFIGMLPGLGGAMSDWMSYGSTVAAHPDKKFGTGEIVGVIGPEGSNNAQKATSMIPTVLFGIPGASFAAVLMALFMYLGFELGTPDLVYDTKFFSSLTYGFMWATVLVGIICIIFTPYISRIAYVPYKYYFPLLLIFITWACVQYTGGWEDYAMLVICSILGIVAKRIKFSRAAILVAFILAERIENLTIQTFTLYNVENLMTRPIFITIMVISIGCLVYGISNKNKLEYS